jgi:RimJ/RimL family protein N-acetyltransferase
MNGACDAPTARSAPFAHLQLVTAALRIAPCDADAAQALAHITADPRVGVPYRVARCAPGDVAEDAARWPQGPDAWETTGRLKLAVRLHHGETVGAVQFTGQQLSYFLAPAVWRQGLGREMVEAACRHYPPLLGLARLHASVLRENIGSRRVLESAGFVFSGLETRRWRGMQGIATMLRYERRGTSERGAA